MPSTAAIDPPCRISILGCGWMGLPVGEALVRSGLSARGSTTLKERLPELEAAGITPYHLHFTPEAEPRQVRDFFNSKILFITIPARYREEEQDHSYLQQLLCIGDYVQASAVEWVILASSTGVYPDESGHFREEEAVYDNFSPASRRMLLEAEALVQQWSRVWTILRFAGLYGYQRQLIRHVSGKPYHHPALKPVNLVHRDDCVGVLSRLIEVEAREVSARSESQVHNQIFNVCSDGHPTRQVYYTRQAEIHQLPPPEFLNLSPVNVPQRTISNDKIRAVLDYEFLHPDPLEPAP